MLVACMFENWTQTNENQRARVIGHTSDGWFFEPVLYPDIEFPNNGEVLVPTRLLPEHVKRYRAVILEVSRVREVIPDNWFCEYKARRYEKNLTEVITLGCFSNQLDIARSLLQEGISLPYPVCGEICIEFQDGIIVGPTDIKTRDSGYTFYCDPDTFTLPINAWQSRDRLDVITYERPNYRTRYFLGTLNPPQRDFVIDMAPLKVTLASVVKFACKKGPGTYWLSKKDQETLVDRLASVGDCPEHIEVRIPRVLEILKVSEETGVIVNEQLDAIMNTPKMHHELEAIRMQIQQEEKQKLFNSHQQLLETIKQLEEKKQSLERELGDASSLVEQAKERIIRVGEETVTQIASQIAKAMTNPSELLSQVALLKPFIRADITANATAGKLQCLTREISIFSQRQVAVQSEILEIFSDNFIALGMLKKDAKLLAREVYSAILCGQWIFFRGSLASVFVKTVAMTVNSEKSCLIRIPVGFQDSFCVDEVIIELNQCKQPVALGILGVNNSCIDSYGQALIELVTNRSIFGTTEGPILLGALSDSCSAINGTFQLESLGPVFDTDCFLLKRNGDGNVLPTTITIVDRTNLNVDSNIAYPEELSDIIGRCHSVIPNNLWHVNVKTAYKVLLSLYEGVEAMAVKSLLYGWILPRAIDNEVNLSEFALFISGEIEEHQDQRVVNLFNKLGEIEAND